MNTIEFLRQEKRRLSFGVTFALFSSFGQTYFLSLFVPSFLIAFELSNASFGSMYSAATILGALLFPWVGQLIDRIPLRNYTIFVASGLLLASFTLSLAWHVVVLFVALVLLRLFGQALSSHASSSSMARFFVAERGKALSIASVGFPLGEAIFPTVITGLLAVVSWRISWVLFTVVILVLFFPVLSFLTRRETADPLEADGSSEGALDGEWGGVSGGESGGESGGVESVGGDDGNIVGAGSDDVVGSGDGGTGADGGGSGEGADGKASRPGVWQSYGKVLGDSRTYLVLPAILIPPFWGTGLFLYQVAAAESLGWSASLIATAFIFFAFTRIAFALLSGPVIDRFSAQSLFPVYLMPLTGGLAAALFLPGDLSAYLYLGLIGATFGLGSTLKSALWAELYGTRVIGTIQSLFGTLMVISTALSPVIVGWMLDELFTMLQILEMALWTTAAGLLISVGITRAKRGERTVQS